jgi:predicted metal-dependent peptidase
LSTLSEIAANLLKREHMTEAPGAQGAAPAGMGWEQLMALSREKDVLKWQAQLSDLISRTQGQRRVTVMRVIQGGLS